MDAHNSVYQQVFHVLESQKLVNTHSVSKIREIIVHILIFTFLEAVQKKEKNLLKYSQRNGIRPPNFELKIKQIL